MINCKFTSEWSGGEIVTTDCTYDESTGQVNPEVSHGVIPTGELITEYITLYNGDEIEVCCDCHEYVMRTVMVPMEYNSSCLYESTECRDKNCISH
jgi:hypothetical protein